MEGNRARITFVFHLALSTNKMSLIKGAIILAIREKRTAPIIVGASNLGKVSDKIILGICNVTVVERQSLTVKLCTTLGAEDVQKPNSFLQ